MTQIIMRGGEISGNKAMKEGGAVHAVDKDCIFYLYDGKITGNTSVDGGAIYVNQEPSTLSMHGGEISGNTATGNGGGISVTVPARSVNFMEARLRITKPVAVAAAFISIPATAES